MNEFVKMDIFFTVTTISVVILTIFLVILLIYAIKVFRNLKYISDKMKHEGDRIVEDMQALRENIKNEGFKIKQAFSFVSSIINRRKKGK